MNSLTFHDGLGHIGLNDVTTVEQGRIGFGCLIDGANDLALLKGKRNKGA